MPFGTGDFRGGDRIKRGSMPWEGERHEGNPRRTGSWTVVQGHRRGVPGWAPSRASAIPATLSRYALIAWRRPRVEN
jgi:hypothetical protein